MAESGIQTQGVGSRVVTLHNLLSTVNSQRQTLLSLCEALPHPGCDPRTAQALSTSEVQMQKHLKNPTCAWGGAQGLSVLGSEGLTGKDRR